MRLSLYVDIYPGMQTTTVFANSNPSKKMSNAKRYKINCIIPDPFEPDDEIEASSVEEVDGES